MTRDTNDMAEKAMETAKTQENNSNETEAKSKVTLDKRHLAICPLDGRYANIEERLQNYFSEFALVKARVFVEVNWLVFLLEHLPKCSILEEVYYNLDGHFDEIEAIAQDFGEEEFLEVKSIEATTNHDVKSCELFVAKKLRELGLPQLVSFVHIGLTSEDVTNLAYAKILNEFIHQVYVPELKKLIYDLCKMAKDNADVPMLAHTHGQPATPTTIGKELSVYVWRLANESKAVEESAIMGKINGATGNYSALSVAFPDVDWEDFAEDFVENYICVDFNPVTTQIESHDYTVWLLDSIRHINNIIRDLDTDMWLYISMNYFKLKPKKEEVGSSTMPHKVNPINFENSEGNIKIGNPICYGLSEELPRSRMQRDLSDSTLQRNIGLAFGYSLQAILQTRQGLSKSEVNKDALAADLENNWAVLAEPIQTMLRKYGVPDAYDQLKELTRGKTITKEDIHTFVKSLDMLSDEDKKTLLELTPSDYNGYAMSLAVSCVMNSVYYLEDEESDKDD